MLKIVFYLCIVIGIFDSQIDRKYIFFKAYIDCIKPEKNKDILAYIKLKIEQDKYVIDTLILDKRDADIKSSFINNIFCVNNKDIMKSEIEFIMFEFNLDDFKLDDVESKINIFKHKHFLNDSIDVIKKPYSNIVRYKK